MQKQVKNLKTADVGDEIFGFELSRKEYAKEKQSYAYILRHKKSGAELFFFERADENKTFAVSFKTLPEDNTGVFHILEHSVLNGSDKYPVKEPFVSMLQSSMQTFLNAMTFSDKTMYPISSRNERDFFNLMSVYLDAVFNPMIYKRPEIFMQEGWHYEFENEDSEPYYNGVVFSEMKGVYADVDNIIDDETNKLLFPDNSYGKSSGGDPKCITDLTYEQFINTHKRFYHPANAKFFLDGNMDIDAVLEFIDREYLSKYDYEKPDFDFVFQDPTTGENTVYYEIKPDEEKFSHMCIAKIFGEHSDVVKNYAARILADYLTGTNESPLKRYFLENGLTQDVFLSAGENVYQSSMYLVFKNTAEENFEKIKQAVPQIAEKLANDGLNKESLSASLARFAFINKEISEPYGIELAMKVMDAWLYGDDPLTHIENAEIFDILREKINTDYFENLLQELLCDPTDKCYLYVLPSEQKAKEDAAAEAEKVRKASEKWSVSRRKDIFAEFKKMQEWQQSVDGEDVLATLPHLDLKDVKRSVKKRKTTLKEIVDTDVLEISTDTNGIVYLNLFFDISDLSLEELSMLSVILPSFGELRTENYSAKQLQTKIKATFGSLGAKIDLVSKTGDLENCRPYLLVFSSMLQENFANGTELLKEIILNGRYDEKDKIRETVLQNDYMLKQALISSGHIIAITKSLSAFSKTAALKESLEGETYVKWYSEFAKKYDANVDENSEIFESLLKKAFCRNRLFAGVCGGLDTDALKSLVGALPENELGHSKTEAAFGREFDSVEISSSVGFSALGNNLYALGSQYTGACSVLSSLMTYGYLWNEVRVKGGAYGTGMSIRTNGDMFCYSYRDPNLSNTKKAFEGTVRFLEDYLKADQPLDDIIIGTVNTSDPLLDPSGICDSECLRYLKGITHGDIEKIRCEILDTSKEDLEKLLDSLKNFIKQGKFCAVADSDTIRTLF